MITHVLLKFNYPYSSTDVRFNNEPDEDIGSSSIKIIMLWPIIVEQSSSTSVQNFQGFTCEVTDGMQKFNSGSKDPSKVRTMTRESEKNCYPRE